MTDENKTKLVPFKFPQWFRDGLASAKTKSPERTATEIVMSAVCSKEKIKKPKGWKFVKPTKRG